MKSKSFIIRAVEPTCQGHTILNIVWDLLLRTFIFVSPKCLLTVRNDFQDHIWENIHLKKHIRSLGQEFMLCCHTFSRFYELKYLFSIVNNFLPQACNEYPTLKPRKVSDFIHITNYTKPSNCQYPTSKLSCICNFWFSTAKRSLIS